MFVWVPALLAGLGVAMVPTAIGGFMKVAAGGGGEAVAPGSDLLWCHVCQHSWRRHDRRGCTANVWVQLTDGSGYFRDCECAQPTPLNIDGRSHHKKPSPGGHGGR